MATSKLCLSKLVEANMLDLWLCMSDFTFSSSIVTYYSYLTYFAENYGQSWLWQCSLSYFFFPSSGTVLKSRFFFHRNTQYTCSGRNLHLCLFSLIVKNRTSLTLNMFFASLKYTTPSFDASMTNTISSLTFILAVALRWVEEVNIFKD